MADIKLKNWYGKEVEHDNVSTITVKDKNGNDVVFEPKLGEGVIVMPYVTQLVGNNGVFYNASNLPATIEIIAENCTFASSVFRFCPSVVKTVKLRLSDNATSLNALLENSSVVTIYFNFSTGKVENWYRTFAISSLRYIYGEPIDFRSCNTTSITTCAQAANIEYIRVVPSTLRYSLNLVGSSRLTNESIVSIANGCALSSGSVSSTLTLHSTVKSNIDNIVGKIVDGLFEIDNTGTTTLRNFITNTKGWTIV